MVWRHLKLVRAGLAAGLVVGSLVGTRALAGAGAGTEPERPAPSVAQQPETVRVLDAQKAGVLGVELRGNGADRVHLSLLNTSGRRLNVVLPPGLVAASATGQGAGGFQSMGLGPAPANAGGFGQFVGNGNGNGSPGGGRPTSGFRSVAPGAGAEPAGIIVPAGQQVDVVVPAVCLNFGLPTPTPADQFRLVDVDDYTSDVRVRRALRTLAEYGTSHGTAQAVMWRLCNNVSYAVMVREFKSVNRTETALAARFIAALERSSDAVDPAYLTEGRVFVTVAGDGNLARDAKRLAAGLDGRTILGLPARMIAPGEVAQADGPAVHLVVTLGAGADRGMQARVNVMANRTGTPTGWASLGEVAVRDSQVVSSLDAEALARQLDRAVASGFVAVKVSKRSSTGTVLKVENRLPLSLAAVELKTSSSAGTGLVAPALGVGPGRSGTVVVPATTATIERVELNGL